MRHTILCSALFGGMLLLNASLLAQGPSWQPLFNGEDLSGWKIIGKEK